MLYIVLPTHTEPISVRRAMVDETIQAFPEAKIICSNDYASKGKGWAVREGFKDALLMSNDEDLFAFIDGDGDIHPSMLKLLLDKINSFDIVVGKKQISGLLVRRIVTFLSRVYIRIKFNIMVDTQTGIKLFKKKALLLVNEDGFMFDLAMLLAAKYKGFTMTEVPIIASIKKSISLKAIFSSFKATLTI